MVESALPGSYELVASPRRRNSSPLPQHERRTQSSRYILSDKDDLGVTLYIWTLCAAIAIVSTKVLLVDKDFHYPLHLLWLHLLGAGGLRLVCQLWRPRGFQPVLAQEPTGDGPQLSRWAGVLLHTLAVLLGAIALPLFVQALLHFENLPTLTMLSV